jgi:hypothetical protein
MIHEPLTIGRDDFYVAPGDQQRRNTQSGDALLFHLLSKL